MKSLRFRVLILGTLGLLAPACHVYDENLLDAEYPDVQDVQIPPDVVDDDAGMMIEEDVQVIEEDVIVDTGPDCIGVVMGGAACIGPYSGQSSTADDLRMPAPQSLLVTLNQQILVGDIGTGRVLAFPAPGTDGSAPGRVIGTGIQGLPRPAPIADAGPADSGSVDSGGSTDAGSAMEAGADAARDGSTTDVRTDAPVDGARDGSLDGAMDGGMRDAGGPPPVTALTQSLIEPAAMEILPNGDILIADAGAHALYVWHKLANVIAPFGTASFTYGPVALRRLDADTMLVSADNQIFAMTITGSVPGTLTPIIGQSCGMNCRGFNAGTVAGTTAQVNLPTGIDFDDNYIYFADSQNCRVRRASRTSGDFTVDTLAGLGCDRSTNLAGAGTGQLLASDARLGPIGDVRMGANGVLFLTDALYRCAIFSVDTTAATPHLSLVAGRTDFCSTTQGDLHNAILGQLGQLALSIDKSALYYVDKTFQKVGRISVVGAPTAPTFPIDPGPTPTMDEDPATVRAGGVSGVTAVTDDQGQRVFFGDLTARRVYFAAPDPADPMGPLHTNVAAGAGSFAITGPSMSGKFVEPFTPIGIAEIPDPDHRHRLFVGMPDHDIIGMMLSSAPVSVYRVAGTYDTPPPAAQMNTPLFNGPATSDTVLGPQWPTAVGSATSPTDLLFTTDEPGRVILVPGGGTFSGAGMQNMRLIAGPSAGQAGTAIPQSGMVQANMAKLDHPTGVTFNPTTGEYFVASAVDHVVYRITVGGQISVLAGISGATTPLSDAMHPASQTAMLSPYGLAFDADRNRLYIADADANRIRAVDVTANPPTMVTIAGHDPVDMYDLTPRGDYGPAANAVIAHPYSLAYSGGLLWVGELYSGRVRVIYLP